MGCGASRTGPLMPDGSAWNSAASEQDRIYIVDIQRLVLDRLQQWKTLRVPVVSTEIRDILVEFSKKSWKLQGLVRYGQDALTGTTHNNDIQLAFITSAGHSYSSFQSSTSKESKGKQLIRKHLTSQEFKLRILDDLAEALSDISLHSIINSSSAFPGSSTSTYGNELHRRCEMSMFIETQAEVAWGVQLIQVHVVVVDDVMAVSGEIKHSFHYLNSAQSQQVSLQEHLSRTVLVDKANLLKQEIEPLLSSHIQQSPLDEKRKEIASAVRYHADQFVKLFDSASLEHARSDRYKFWCFLTEAYHHLVMLYWICDRVGQQMSEEQQQDKQHKKSSNPSLTQLQLNADLHTGFLDDIPAQIFNQIGKNEFRDLLSVEPRSNLHIPGVNNLKKEYSTLFWKVMIKLEERLSVDFNAKHLHSVLSFITLRDYFQNFRDPALVNPSKFRIGKMFRSATLNSYSDEELMLLFEKTKIKTVIDIRSPDDIKNKTYTATFFGRNSTAAAGSNEFNVNSDLGSSGDGEDKQAPLVLSTSDYLFNDSEDATGQLEIKYFSVPIKPWTAKKIPAEVGQVDLKHLANVSEENSFGFYEIFPRYFQKEILEVFKLLVNERKPVLVHCTLGKDRTGCVIALLEKLLSYSDEEIVSDYMNSARNAVSINIETFLRVLQEYGGAEAFLIHIGLSKPEIEKLKREFASGTVIAVTPSNPTHSPKIKTDPSIIEAENEKLLASSPSTPERGLRSSGDADTPNGSGEEDRNDQDSPRDVAEQSEQSTTTQQPHQHVPKSPKSPEKDKEKKEAKEVKRIREATPKAIERKGSKTLNGTIRKKALTSNV